MSEVRRNARGAVILDDRYAPLVITTFLGETDLELGQWFTEAHKRLLVSHASLGRRIVSISDATLARKPSPEMRRFWAERTANSGDPMKGAALASFLVVSSPVLRGAITAIGWLNPALREIESFSTIDDAIRAALARLIQADLPVPKLSGPYQLPDTAQKARAAFAR